MYSLNRPAAGSVRTTSPMGLSRMSRMFCIGLTVLVEPVFAARDFFADGFLQKFVVGGQLNAAGRRMPEVKAQCAAAQIQPPDTRVHQPGRKLRVFAAPAGEIFIV